MAQDIEPILAAIIEHYRPAYPKLSVKRLLAETNPEGEFSAPFYAALLLFKEDGKLQLIEIRTSFKGLRSHEVGSYCAMARQRFENNPEFREAIEKIRERYHYKIAQEDIDFLKDLGIEQYDPGDRTLLSLQSAHEEPVLPQPRSEAD